MGFLNSRNLFYLGGIYLLGVVIASWGFAVGRFHVFPAEQLDQIADFLNDQPNPDAPVSVVEKMTKAKLEEKTVRGLAQGFVRHDESFVDPGFLLLPRFSATHKQFVIELVRLSDFRVLHQWVPPIEVITAKLPDHMKTGHNVPDTFVARHPLLLKDGSIIAHTGMGPLFRIDKQSRLVWTWDTLQPAHHSIALDPDGNVMVVGDTLNNGEKLPAIDPELSDGNVATPLDGYFTVSAETGKVLRRDHIAEILAENGYESLIYGLYLRNDFGDPLHLNDAEPVLVEQAGIARRGDVLISLRNISTVLIYRPSTRKVIWLRTGPWIAQHDVDLLPDGRLHVHSNNSSPWNSTRLRSFSEVYVIDPTTDRIELPYHQILSELGVFNLTEGLSRILPNGDLYFEQTNSGWAFRASPERLRWEFVNQTRPDFVGRVSWSRYFLPEEITLDWLDANPGEENEWN